MTMAVPLRTTRTVGMKKVTIKVARRTEKATRTVAKGTAVATVIKGTRAETIIRNSTAVATVIKSMVVAVIRSTVSTESDLWVISRRATGTIWRSVTGTILSLMHGTTMTWITFGEIVTFID